MSLYLYVPNHLFFTLSWSLNDRLSYNNRMSSVRDFFRFAVTQTATEDSSSPEQTL